MTTHIDLYEIRATKLGHQSHEDLQKLLEGGTLNFEGEHQIGIADAAEDDKENTTLQLNSAIYLSAFSQKDKKEDNSDPVFIFEAHYQTLYVVRGQKIEKLDNDEEDRLEVLHTMGKLAWPYFRSDFIYSLDRAGLKAARLPHFPPEGLF